MTFLRKNRKWLALSFMGLLVVGAGGASTLIAGCGPFTDVSGGQCAFVLELYYSGIAGGTSATTFDPTGNVTRGQVAVFMGAAMNYLLRNSNPFRIATRQSNIIFNFDGEDYATANTGNSNGFCTDGMYNYVANQTSNKIDVYYNGFGNNIAGTFTTVTGNNRLACGPTYLYATNIAGTAIKRINTHTGVVTDPWITQAGLTGDIINLGYEIVATTGTGLVLFDEGGHNPPIPVALGGFTYGVVVDQFQGLWANTATKLWHVSNSGTILAPAGGITLTGPTGTWYPVFDGASTWVPLGANGIDIVSTAGVIIDHRNLSDWGATSYYGSGFDGRHVFFSASGDYTCGGSNGNLLVSFEARSHSPFQAIETACVDGGAYTIGYDGRYVHNLIYAAPKHFIY